MRHRRDRHQRHRPHVAEGRLREVKVGTELAHAAGVLAGTGRQRERRLLVQWQRRGGNDVICGGGVDVVAVVVLPMPRPLLQPLRHDRSCRPHAAVAHRASVVVGVGVGVVSSNVLLSVVVTKRRAQRVRRRRREQ